MWAHSGEQMRCARRTTSLRCSGRPQIMQLSAGSSGRTGVRGSSVPVSGGRWSAFSRPDQRTASTSLAARGGRRSAGCLQRAHFSPAVAEAFGDSTFLCGEEPPFERMKGAWESAEHLMGGVGVLGVTDDYLW